MPDPALEKRHLSGFLVRGDSAIQSEKQAGISAFTAVASRLHCRRNAFIVLKMAPWGNGFQRLYNDDIWHGTLHFPLDFLYCQASLDQRCHTESRDWIGYQRINLKSL